MDAHKLQDHFFKTYVALRVGIAIIGLFLPFILWLGGLAKGIEFQDSMSAYYHALPTMDVVAASDSSQVNLSSIAMASREHFTALTSPTMRDWFVGVLFAVGVFLHLYKGFTNEENIALNFAGLFAIGVAIFPMAWGRENPSPLSLHGTCAVLFFLCIAYVCIFRASDTLKHLKNPILEWRLGLVYKLIGGAMVASPLIAYLMLVVLKQASAYTFFIEAAGIWVFSIYWLVKSYELYQTKADKMVLRGEELA